MSENVDDRASADEVKAAISVFDSTGKERGVLFRKKFMRINDNDYTNERGEPLILYAGAKSEGIGKRKKGVEGLTPVKLKQLAFDAIDYLRSEAEIDPRPFPKNLLKKLKVPESGSRYVRIDISQSLGRIIDQIEQTYGQTTKEEEEPTVKKDPNPPEEPSAENVRYKDKTAKQISEEMPAPSIDVYDIDHEIRLLYNELQLIRYVRDRRTSGKIAIEDDGDFQSYNVQELRVLDPALEQKIKNYEQARYDRLVEHYTIVSQVFAKIHNLKISGQRVDAGEYNSLVAEFRKEVNRELEPEIRTVVKSIAPEDVNETLLENEAGDLLLLEDVQEEDELEGLPPLEEISTEMVPVAPNGPDGGPSGGPGAPDGEPNNPEPVAVTAALVEPPVVPSLGIVIPGKYQPKYHKRIIKEFFGSDVNPDWDKELTTVIMSEKAIKDELIKDIDDIIMTYGKKFLIRKRLSDGDIDEYHELRQLVFCWKRGLQKGTRSRQALVKLSDLTNLSKSAQAPVQGPIAPSQVNAALSTTTNAPTSAPNIPFYTEEPENSDRGKYIDARIVRPKVFSESYY